MEADKSPRHGKGRPLGLRRPPPVCPYRSYRYNAPVHGALAARSGTALPSVGHARPDSFLRLSWRGHQASITRN